MLKNCFMAPARICSNNCVAYVTDSKTSCRILNTFDRLIPLPMRPVSPAPPKVNR